MPTTCPKKSVVVIIEPLAPRLRIVLVVPKFLFEFHEHVGWYLSHLLPVPLRVADQLTFLPLIPQALVMLKNVADMLLLFDCPAAVVVLMQPCLTAFLRVISN